MKIKLTIAALAAACGVHVASACHIYVTVACPNNGNSARNINVCAFSQTNPNEIATCGDTDSTGFVDLFTPGPDTYAVVVDTSTLPANATLLVNTKIVTCVNPGVSVTFDLSGDLCGPPPQAAFCWLTGGGTIGNGKTPTFSYGGVVYPGCSPKAADGGNWNVINHDLGLHFQGEHIVVDFCSGPGDKSPKVPVNIIDFHGNGEVVGVGGNSLAMTTVTFIGRAIDNGEPGHGKDQLYLLVLDPSGTPVPGLQIGTGTPTPGVLPLTGINPATVTTGNLQIHISSCGK